MCARKNINQGKEIEKDGDDVGIERVSKVCLQLGNFKQILFF